MTDPRSHPESHPEPPPEALPEALPDDDRRIPGVPSIHVLDHLFEGCQILDFDLRYLYLNPQAARHARLPRGKLIGRRMAEVYPGIDETEMFRSILRCLERREPVAMENRFRYEDGLERIFDLRMEPVPEGVFILSMDVTERKAANERLRQSEAMLSRAEQIAGVGSWIYEFEEDRVIWSKGLFRILQMDPEDGAPPFPEQEAVFHPDDWPTVKRAVERAIEHGRFYVVPARMLRLDGTCRSCVARGYPEMGADGKTRRLYGIVQDITELQALQEQAQKRQRLESIGSLAGGVAHDFNNILMAQMGFCDMIADELPPNDSLREGFAEIRACADRAAELTRQLLAFSRRQTLQPVVLDLNDVVRDLESLLRRLIGEDVLLEVCLDGDLGFTMADPSQVEQIIMNLAVNSRDAMPGGGRLTIETSNVDLDMDYVEHFGGSTPGPHVMLAISDTGVGMDETTREHLFEPFFTTKDVGFGTGMGLATVYGIVKQSGGIIRVYSEPGEGSTFRVFLPLVESRPSDDPVEPDGEVVGGREVILVVEDDEAVARLMRRMLGKLGYEVRQAMNADEALRAVRDEGLRPDLLITDVVMPGMGGGELSRRIREMLPTLQVLFMSGYTENSIVHQGVLDPDVAYLQKPFSFEDLALRIRQLLDPAAS